MEMAGIECRQPRLLGPCPAPGQRDLRVRRELGECCWLVRWMEERTKLEDLAKLKNLPFIPLLHGPKSWRPAYQSPAFEDPSDYIIPPVERSVSILNRILERLSYRYTWRFSINGQIQKWSDEGLNYFHVERKFRKHLTFLCFVDIQIPVGRRVETRHVSYKGKGYPITIEPLKEESLGLKPYFDFSMTSLALFQKQQKYLHNQLTEETLYLMIHDKKQTIPRRVWYLARRRSPKWYNIIDGSFKTFESGWLRFEDVESLIWEYIWLSGNNSEKKINDRLWSYERDLVRNNFAEGLKIRDLKEDTFDLERVRAAWKQTKVHFDPDDYRVDEQIAAMREGD